MTDLVTLDEYKSWKQKTSDTDDTKIEILIVSLSKLVKTYCGKSIVDFFGTDTTEYFNILEADTSVIFPIETPIVSITSLKERTSQSSSYTEIFTEGASSKYEYSLDSTNDAIWRIDDNSMVAYPMGFKSVELVYKGGYTDTPEDLKLGVYHLIDYYLNQEWKPRQTLDGATRENPSPAKDTNSWPPHIKRILDLYKVLP